MSNTKDYVFYNVCLNPEFINTSDSTHKTYSEAKQAIADKIAEFKNNSTMSDDNKAYWINRYNNAIIVEYVAKYTVV